MSFEPHVLIVDDDARIRTLLTRFLVRSGLYVTAARDAAHARRLLASLDFDLAVLDVMMPGEDGVSLARHLRGERNMAVLILTAKGELEDRITGLEAGVDDYLSKPFEPRELLLRINAILRRLPQEEPAQTSLHLGSLRYDVARAELWDGGRPVRLTSTEVALMRIFAASPGEAVARTRLIDDLGRTGPEGEGSQDRSVDVQITRLRRKIEPDPKAPRYLQTVRGSGYMLSPD